MMPEDLNKWYVRNSSGTMVPFSAFATGIVVSERTPANITTSAITQAKIGR
jgi:multidrug efflux pump subunit AcrB